MPIKISIKNLDSSQDAVIMVKMQKANGEPVSDTYASDTRLRGGEEIEKFLHIGQHLVVVEI